MAFLPSIVNTHFLPMTGVLSKISRASDESGTMRVRLVLYLASGITNSLAPSRSMISLRSALAASLRRVPVAKMNCDIRLNADG